MSGIQWYKNYGKWNKQIQLQEEGANLLNALTGILKFVKQREEEEKYQ
jgi:hypothetical protein